MNDGQADSSETYTSQKTPTGPSVTAIGELNRMHKEWAHELPVEITIFTNCKV